jgi:hypothetical protein
MTSTQMLLGDPAVRLEGWRETPAPRSPRTSLGSRSTSTPIIFLTR